MQKQTKRIRDDHRISRAKRARKCTILRLRTYRPNIPIRYLQFSRSFVGGDRIFTIIRNINIYK